LNNINDKWNEVKVKLYENKELYNNLINEIDKMMKELTTTGKVIQTSNKTILDFRESLGGNLK